MANIDAKSCIAGQYEILKRIFSYLTSRDLVVMTQVCKDWRSIASKFIESTVECYELNDYTVVNSRLIPRILLFFSEVDIDSLPDKISKPQRQKVIDFWKHKFISNCMDNVSAVFFMACNSLMCTAVKGLVQKPSEAYEGEHVLVIPEVPGVNVELVSVQPIRTGPRIETVTASRIGYGCRRESAPLEELLSSSKLVLFFVRDTRQPVVSHCLRHLTSPMVGGKPALFFVDDEKEDDLALLSFSGDKVEAYADVLRRPSQSDSFFEKMAAEVGPLPAGAQRFAFVFACIDLKHVFNTASFVKHFPNVPFYGIWSFTEYASPSSAHRTSAKRSKMNFVYTRCVSVAVVTLLE